MADEKLTQKAKDHVQQAGDNAQQIQAGTVIINNGLNESQVRAICSEMSYKAMEEYTAESHLTVEKRISDFANVLIPRIEKIENGFEAFADPEFQVELKKAQISSACTDREADYEMLAELLLHRVENKDNRRVKASITKAVEIVDKIDDDALQALTVAYSVIQFTPTNGMIKDGLNTLNYYFGQLPIKQLPKDNSWVSYLDILDVIRASQIGNFKKMITIYSEKLTGYLAVGIKKESENYYKAIEILNKANMNEKVFVEHELIDGYLRLPVPNKEYISETKRTINIPQLGITLPVLLSDNEKTALYQVWELYEKNGGLINQIREKFAELVNSFENLVITKEWWDSIPNSFGITPIGRVLAHANAQRYAKIPELELGK